MINIKSDSRKVNKGDIFVALKGISSNGDSYIESAIKNGASKVVVSNGNKYSVDTLNVSDTRKYLLDYLEYNYSKNLNDMTIIGITGTNGKTTTSFLVYEMLNKLNIKCGYIGTIGYYLDKKVCSLPNTSPDICDIYDMLINAYENDFKVVVMEVSSQGLSMGRFETIKFDIAAFTNLTQDHLDYHKTMENYALAKQILFNNIKDDGVSIINSDSKYFEYFKSKKTLYYGKSAKDYKIENINNSYKTTFTLSINNISYDITSPLIGEFNIYNLVCAIGIIDNMYNNIKDILSTIKYITPPMGRFDIINYKDNLIIVDYAHTPDAMENIFNTVNKIKKGKVYTVFGCTGNRDKTKRPIMMDLSIKNSDYTIVTMDDLHNESFSDIVSDMTNNINGNYEIIMDRKSAIIKSISYLDKFDILLVLGKGHEDFIIVGDNKIPFNDKNVILDYINNLIEV